MNKSRNISTVYFIGAGGIGMSALVRYCLANGIAVAGYDRERSQLCVSLEKEGAILHYDEQDNAITDSVDLIVYTPAIAVESTELKAAFASGKKVIKRAEFLAQIANKGKLIAVAGAHGKTTVTAMITHILAENKKAVTGFVGGICNNFDGNFITKGNDYFVVEADEFDRSFLHLKPFISVVTALDSDHTEIYPDRKALIAAFSQFVGQTNDDGYRVQHAQIVELERDVPSSSTAIAYHLNSGGTLYRTTQIELDKGTSHFEMQGERFVLNMAGLHNIENAVAAITVCQLLGLSLSEIAETLATFTGIQRRFQFVLNTEKTILIDDYAHHPEEVRAFLSSVKAIFPAKKVKAIFQPHLFSRTEEFAAGFANALTIADEVVLMEIYPARELPIEGVTSELIQVAIPQANPQIFSTENITDALTANEEVVATIGAGSIGKCVPRIADFLKNCFNNQLN